MMNLEEKLAMELGTRDLQIIKLLNEVERLQADSEAKGLIIEELQPPVEDTDETVEG